MSSIPPGAVVHLVQPAPHERHVVADPVPPVVHERDRHVAGDRAAERPEALGRPEAVSGQARLRGEAEHQHERELDAADEERARPPSGDRGPAPRRHRQLDQEQRQPHADEHERPGHAPVTPLTTYDRDMGLAVSRCQQTVRPSWARRPANAVICASSRATISRMRAAASPSPRAPAAAGTTRTAATRGRSIGSPIWLQNVT